MEKQANNYCLDFAQFYEARSAKIKPIGSFLQVPDMNQRTSDSNASITDEEVSQQDKRTAPGMGGKISTQAYLDDLKWPTKKLSKQQQQKRSTQHQAQAQERMCAHRSGCGMHRCHHPGDYLAQQPHQCQKYQKNFNQSPAKQQQPSQDPQQQQPQQQYLEQKNQTPPMPKQCLQTSHPKRPQEQAQRNDSPKKASSIRASTKGMTVLFRRPPRRSPEASNPEIGQPSSRSSNTDEENFADNISEPDKKTSNKYMEFLPQHYSHKQQHPHEQYRPALNQNSRQRNQGQKKAPISKTKDVLSPRPHQYSPQKPEMLCKNMDVIDFDKYLKGLDKNSSHKYMEYAPELCQSPPHQTCENILHKHTQEHYQMNSQSRQKVGKQQPDSIHLQQQSYQNPCENTARTQAKDIPLSPPHQYSGLLVPDKCGRGIGGELLAKNSDILPSTSLSDTSEKNCEESTVKQKKYNKCGRCSDENGMDSTSTGSTVVTVNSGDNLRSMVRDELCALVRNEIEIQSVFGELSDTVVCHVKDYLCGMSTTDNVPPPKSQYKEESVSTNAPKNSAIDNVLDTKKQESYQTQKKASPSKGISKAQEVQLPQNPGLARKNAGELQSMSTLYKSMEYVPKQVSLQNPTQRTYQDLTKEQTQESYQHASYHKKQKQHSHRTLKREAKRNPQQKQHPNQQIADFPPFSRFSDTPEDDSEESNFGVDKKTPNKFMEYYGKGSPKDKPKHRLSSDEHEVFSMASSNSVSTSISRKSGDKLRAVIRDEMELQSVLGDQTSMCSQLSRTNNATSSQPRYKGLEEKVSTLSDSNPPRDDTHPCSNVSKFQDMKETMSTPIGSLPNVGIDINVPTTDSFKGSTTDEMPQIECSMSVDDLVSCKVITPMIMKIHNKYMTSMQDEMHLMKYLETVPRLVGQIYKDNITMEQRKL